MAIIKSKAKCSVRLYTVLFLSSLVILIQCKSSTGPGNTAPQILSLIPSKSIVDFQETISVKADVSDIENDSLAFLWIANQGSFTFTSLDSAIWRAPSVSGTADIVLRVNDPFNGIDVDSVIINIQNQLPVISSLTASENNILVGNIIILNTTATEPDGGLLTYQWSSDDGEFIGSTTETQATWRATTSVSSVTITVTVTDEDNGSASRDIEINVFQELGSVWISDKFNDQIVKLASNGTQLFRIFGLKQPRGMAVDNSDRTLWIADWGNDRVVKYSADGEELFVINGVDQGFERPTDIAISSNGNVWVTSMSDSSQVIEMLHDGNLLRKFTGFSDPQSIDIFLLTGEVWIADTGNNLIRVFPMGIISIRSMLCQSGSIIRLGICHNQLHWILIRKREMYG